MGLLRAAGAARFESTACRVATCVLCVAVSCCLALLAGCSMPWQSASDASSSSSHEVYSPTIIEDTETAEPSAEELLAELDLTVSLRPSLAHGPKPAAYQRYIVLHDTEGDGSPMSVVDWWEGNGNLVASQFVVGKDGSIVQCVPLDEIAHHAGYGNAGHNEKYGIVEDGRDDMLGTQSIGLPDYGMNAWSVGIELVHSGDEPYPEAQLEALDKLVAYIDAYYGFESAIIDHKDWREGNSDTSSAFATYLTNYKIARNHLGK